MRRQTPILLFTVATLFFTVSLSALPDNLDLRGPTEASGSDAQAQAFNNFGLTQIFPYILNNSNNGLFQPPASTLVPPTTLLAPESMTLAEDSFVRIYFMASFNTVENSSLGLVTDGDFNLFPGENVLLFPNAKSSPGPGAPTDPDAPYAALSFGDFVDVGAVDQGTVLDFFLLTDGAGPNGTLATLWSDPARNLGQRNQLHTVRFDGTPYHLLAWEDGPLGDIDDDFNDVFAVVQIVPVPEPATYLMIATLLVLAIAAHAQKKSCKNAKIKTKIG